MSLPGRNPRAASRRALPVLAFLAAMTAAWAAGDRARNVSPEEARKLIRENAGNREFVILDVRTPGEFAQGHIEGAVLIDFRSPGFREEMAARDREKTYLVYCRTGNRSARALGIMQELGFSRYYHLAGGILRWVEAEQPTVR